MAIKLDNATPGIFEIIIGVGLSVTLGGLLAVRAGGALHRVTPVRRGERDIVKVVFAFGTERTAAFDENLARTYL
jgi:hypothetical protein